LADPRGDEVTSDGPLAALAWAAGLAAEIRSAWF
jgi:hypothetical protein